LDLLSAILALRNRVDRVGQTPDDSRAADPTGNAQEQ
jgi:hypothetical protein